MWNVDNGAWNASGATVSSLSVGSHTVNFKSIPGWNTPASQTVVISYGLAKTASGTYVLAPPTVESFLINNGAGTTRAEQLRLTIRPRVSHILYGQPVFHFCGSDMETLLHGPSFTLSAANGPKTVYFRVKVAGGVSAKASASIVLAQLPVVLFQDRRRPATTINPT